MKIIKFEVEIFDDVNKNTKNFYKLLFKKLRKEFKNSEVVVVFSIDMMSKLNSIYCKRKPLIMYQTNDNIKPNDIFIYTYCEFVYNDINSTESIILKYYRKEKLKKICSIQDIK